MLHFFMLAKCQKMAFTLTLTMGSLKSSGFPGDLPPKTPIRAVTSESQCRPLAPTGVVALDRLQQASTGPLTKLVQAPGPRRSGGP